MIVLCKLLQRQNKYSSNFSLRQNRSSNGWTEKMVNESQYIPFLFCFTLFCRRSSTPAVFCLALNMTFKMTCIILQQHVVPGLYLGPSFNKYCMDIVQKRLSSCQHKLTFEESHILVIFFEFQHCLLSEERSSQGIQNGNTTSIYQFWENVHTDRLCQSRKNKTDVLIRMSERDVFTFQR